MNPRTGRRTSRALVALLLSTALLAGCATADVVGSAQRNEADATAVQTPPGSEGDDSHDRDHVIPTPPPERPPVHDDPPTDPDTPPAGSLPDADAAARNQVPDSAVGLRDPDAWADLSVVDATDSVIDQISINALADLFAFYEAELPAQFGVDYIRPRLLVSYDSTDPDAQVCGESVYQFDNAFYDLVCGAVAWDRVVLQQDLYDDIGPLAPAVIMSHEIGHTVQEQLGQSFAQPAIVLEQQADCYAGAFWRWVADGHSSYFAFNQGEGMRQLLLSLYAAKDPVGASGMDDDDHGNGFDRTYAAALGFAEGLVRCDAIDLAEIEDRGQEFPFDDVPYQYGNLDITEENMAGLMGAMDVYLTQRAPRYRTPTLLAYTEQPPACDDARTSFPVAYCPASNTVSYHLPTLVKIGTPTDGWESVNGDFAAIVLLASRYALAAQYAGYSPIRGTDAGLQALCYAGSWASWMRDPQEGFSLSPNDMDKAIYEIVSEPTAAFDVDGVTTATILQRVQAFGIGVTHSIGDCFDYYVGAG